jgi:uncharacterized protein YbjT (DUF2867 family)
MAKTAVIIGSTGLVGCQLLQRLLACPRYSKVVSLSRRHLDLSHPKLISHVIDFENLTHYVELFKGDVFFSCLGTTLKQAGSVAAQRKVDFEYQFICAQMAANNGIPHYCLVSSSGANAHSMSRYLKIKGELEQQVKQLGFSRLSVLQPSLLVGERSELRVAEKIAALVLPWITQCGRLKRYKPITGEQVAEKMLMVSLKQQQSIAYYTLDELFESECK